MTSNVLYVWKLDTSNIVVVTWIWTVLTFTKSLLILIKHSSICEWYAKIQRHCSVVCSRLPILSK